VYIVVVNHLNRPLTAIIAEAKQHDRIKLELYAKKIGLNIVSSVGSGEWLIDDCMKFEPDFVFLNISLNGTDGLTAFRTILERGVTPYLIMVSGTKDSDLILQGMRMNCIDFVSKPISIERLVEAVDKVRRMIVKDMLISKAVPGNIIKIKSNYRTVFINENNLIYAEKLKGEHKIIIYIEGGKGGGINTTVSLKEIQNQCSNFIFSPNQSNLVNINYISKVYASEIFVGRYIIQLRFQDLEIDLTRRRKKEFEDLLKEF